MSRRETFIAPLLFLGAALFLYRVVLGGDVGFGWDTIESYWPDLRYHAASIGLGDWSLWNPYDRGGYPIFADPQPGATYPVQWIFALLSAAADHGWWLIQAKVLVHHAICGFTMYAFLRSRRISPAASSLGGLTWLGSTPMLIHKASNILWPLVWLPLVWMAIDFVLAKPSWRRGALLAGALYLAGSAGSPPGFFYVLLFAIPYGGFRLIAAQLSAAAPERRRLAIRMAVALAVAAALTVMLLAISFYPGLELADESTRAKRSIGYALALPMPVTKTLQALLAPALAGPGAYVGVGAMMLAAIALFVAPRRDRGAPIFFTVSGVVFLMLAFGEATPLLEWLVRNAPGFGLFRVANRYKLLFAPALAVLAAYGAEALICAAKSWSRERLSAIVTVALLLAVTVSLALVIEGPARPTRSRWVAVIIATLSAGLIVSCLLAPKRSSWLLIAALGGLIFLDPAYTLFARTDVMEKQPRAAKRAHLEGLDGIESRWRIFDEFAVGERPGSRYRVRDFRGYPSGDPLDFLRYREVLKVAGKTPEILEAFNVRYFLHQRHHRNGFRGHRIKSGPLRKSEHLLEAAHGVFEAKHPVPLVVWYRDAIRKPRNQVLASILESEGADGSRRYAVLEPPAHSKLTAPLTGGPGPPNVVGELLSYAPDRISMTVEAPERGVVVLNEVYYNGWKVSVDGRSATPLRANYLLRAVEVGGGHHEIVWEFRPPAYRFLVLVFALGWLALLVAIAASRRRRRTG